MASLMEELIDVLQRECEIYEQLIPITEEKTKIIVENDLNSLQKITEEEQAVVEQIHGLEKKREEIVYNIGTVINRKPETLQLSVLIQLMEKQPKEQKNLSLVYDRLQHSVQRLTEINFRNKSLIQQSLEMIEFNMNFLQSTRITPGNNTYNKGAAQYNTQGQGSGMFDAKQ